MIDWRPMSERPDKSCPCLIWVKEIVTGWEYEIDNQYVREEDGYEHTGFSIEIADGSPLATKRVILAWCEVDPPAWSDLAREPEDMNHKNQKEKEVIKWHPEREKQEKKNAETNSRA